MTLVYNGPIFISSLYKKKGWRNDIITLKRVPCKKVFLRVEKEKVSQKRRDKRGPSE